jgi:hypothetical protein
MMQQPGDEMVATGLRHPKISSAFFGETRFIVCEFMSQQTRHELVDTNLTRMQQFVYLLEVART